MKRLLMPVVIVAVLATACGGLRTPKRVKDGYELAPSKEVPGDFRPPSMFEVARVAQNHWPLKCTCGHEYTLDEFWTLPEVGGYYADDVFLYSVRRCNHVIVDSKAHLKTHGELLPAIVRVLDPKHG